MAAQLDSRQVVHRSTWSSKAPWARGQTLRPFPRHKPGLEKRRLGRNAPLGSRWRGWSNTPSGSCFSWKCIIAQHLEALPVVTLGSQPAALGSQDAGSRVSSVQQFTKVCKPGAPCQLLGNKNLDAAEGGGAESGSGKTPNNAGGQMAPPKKVPDLVPCSLQSDPMRSWVGQDFGQLCIIRCKPADVFVLSPRYASWLGCQPQGLQMCKRPLGP